MASGKARSNRPGSTLQRDPASAPPPAADDGGRGPVRTLLEALARPETLLTAALAIVVVSVAAHTDADADLWGHLRFGGDIVAAGAVVQADSYSFTTDRKWVNHEWLAEVIMYGAWAVGGSGGIVAAKLAVYLSTLVAVWWALGRDGLVPFTRLGLVVVACAGTLSRATTLRPQVFSLLLFALLLVVIAEHDRRNHRALVWVLPPLFALWVNLHGGWIVGGGVFVIWACVHAVETGWRDRRTVTLGAAGLASLVATLLNPYGSGMWSFLRETVGFGRADIADWQPIARNWAHWVPATVVTATWVAAVARSRGRSAWLAGAVTVALGLATLRVGRIDAFFALAVVVLFAPAFRDVGSQWFSRPVGWRPSQVAGHACVTALAVLAMAWPAAGVVRAGAACVGVSREQRAPEAEMAPAIRAARLRGRMVTWYDYGQYAIWHLAPDVVVSMDGRRETVYSSRVLEAHQRFYRSPREHADYPERLGADLIWLPNFLHAGDPLQARGWRPILTGTASTVWARGQVPQRTLAPAPAGRRCFPGP